jgi:hypothetical protein
MSNDSKFLADSFNESMNKFKSQWFLDNASTSDLLNKSNLFNFNSSVKFCIGVMSVEVATQTPFRSHNKPYKYFFILLFLL